MELQKNNTTNFETLGFGKYANKAIHNVPTRYFRYMYLNTTGKLKERMLQILKDRGEADIDNKMIPYDKLPEMLNKPIHLKWAGGARVWILQKIEGNKVHLVTPKTRKPLIANASDAMYANKHLPKESTNKEEK